MPTRNLAHRDRLIAEMYNLGPEGFQKIIGMLKAPGRGDKPAIRFAINSMARYSSQFGKEKERYFTESNLIKACENQPDKEIQVFLIEELYLVAGENSVFALKKYLSDERLSNSAIQTIIVADENRARQFLLEALQQSGENTAVNLVKALGDIKCINAVKQITSYTESKNQSLRRVSLEALAKIGDPASYKLLLDKAKRIKFGYGLSNETEAFLNYAESLGARNETELCKKACEEVFRANSDLAKLHNYSKALDIYTKYFGFEAMPLLLKGVEINDKPFRSSVLMLANNIKGISTTRQWISKAKAVSPEINSEIIEMLGLRGDLVAKGYITENLNSENEMVSNAAVNALVSLTGKEAVPILINQLASGKNTEASKIGLMQLIDQKHLAPVAGQLQNTNGPIRADFIDLIAAKSGSQFFDHILKYTGSQDNNERSSAFRALKSVSGEKNIEELIKLLLSVQEETEIESIQEAIIAASAGSEIEKSAKGRLVQALRDSSLKERIVAVLPSIGGKENLQIVAGYFANSAGVIKEAAFNALLNWKEYGASKSLYEICQSGESQYRTKALAAFVRQVAMAPVPDDQKLLQYRKIMPFASSVAEKKEIIRNIGRLKTYLSLVYLNSFMEDKELQQEVAQSVMKIALPGSEGIGGFSGEFVKTLLEKTIDVIKGDDSDYYKINIKKYIDSMPGDKGFVSMFNGKNLDGWQGLVENPIARSKMKPEELAKKQEIANKKMSENWSVRDNTIVFSGKGDNLCSIKKYGDFEMIVDWRITKEGDSGIYLRGTPQVQIWDTSRVDVGAQVGSGGLYNNQKNPGKPLKLADNSIGEWNTFRIIMIGQNVTVYLNGELVVDNVILENYWDRNLPIFPSESIELQAHGTDLAFRDIYVREINTKQVGLTKDEISEGFEALFNGNNLEGWQGNLTDYFASNGEMVVQPTRGGHGNIYTVKEYSDFNFRFEFQLTPGANNGLGIRAPLEGDAAYVGMELQILDNTASIYSELHDYQYHGSVYGVIPAKREYLHPVGQWNSEEVIVKGTKVKVILNGVTIVDGDIKEASKNGTLDGKKHPGLLREKGYIGFLGHGSSLKFRNIRLKDLSM